MDFLELAKSQSETIAKILGSIGAIATVLRGAWTYLSRSRLLVPRALPLPEIPRDQVIYVAEWPRDLPPLSTFLAGRSADTANLVRAIREHRLTFIYGESGSGKSTLLKLGVARELALSGTAIPVYVDIWGQDWILGPRRSLAAALDLALRSLNLAAPAAPPITPGIVFQRLRALASESARAFFLIFDQIDDYETAHRARFLDSTGSAFLDPGELCAANEFWREMRDMLLDPTLGLQLVLITRRDAQEGLHCFHFETPKVYPIARVEPVDVTGLIRTLAAEATVRKPENGFYALIDRVVSDLGRGYAGKVLPMQLRVALAGIGCLRGPLTPARLDRIGGIEGLAAKYLEDVIVDAPGAWPILNAMAERTPNSGAKAVNLTRTRILELTPKDQNRDALLQKLIDSRLLRRRLEGSGEETWQLYHDYIAAAVVAVDRRKRRLPLLLASAYEQWRLSSGALQHWTRLLSPFDELNFLRARLFEAGFRFGDTPGMCAGVHSAWS